MSALEVFQFEDEEVRVVLIDGAPHFVLADLCAVLSLANPSAVADRIDNMNLTLAEVQNTRGHYRQTLVVNEAGMWEVVIRSDKPEAVRLRRWITSEVLPSIRRTGAYAAPESREQLLARAMLEANAVISEAHQQIEALTPKAEAWDELADAGTDYAVRDVAPMLSRAGIETGPQRLFESLHELNWIYRGEKQRWTPYARVVNSGYLKVRAMPPYRDRDTGELKPAAPQVRITPRGVERLRVLLGVGALTH